MFFHTTKASETMLLINVSSNLITYLTLVHVNGGETWLATRLKSVCPIHSRGQYLTQHLGTKM